MAEQIYPAWVHAGMVFTDNSDATRKLNLLELVPVDHHGREVRGVINHPGHPDDNRDYACDRSTFKAVWLTPQQRAEFDKKPTKQPEGSQ